MLDLEYASVSQYHSYSRDEVLRYLNPSTWGYGEDEYYQFAVLDDGYSGKVTTTQLNAFINSTLDRYGYDNSVLRDSGATIIAASHALGHERGVSHGSCHSGKRVGNLHACAGLLLQSERIW